MVLKKEVERAIYAMPTCRDETSEAETAAATRGKGKKSVRDVLVTTATIMPLRECIQRELTKRQNFKSRFRLKYVAGNRVPVSLSPSPFFRNTLSSSLVPSSPYANLVVQYVRTPCHLRRILLFFFFQSGNALHVCAMRRARTYRMLDRAMKRTRRAGRGR